MEEINSGLILFIKFEMTRNSSANIPYLMMSVKEFGEYYG